MILNSLCGIYGSHIGKLFPNQSSSSIYQEPIEPCVGGLSKIMPFPKKEGSFSGIGSHGGPINFEELPRPSSHKFALPLFCPPLESPLTGRSSQLKPFGGIVHPAGNFQLEPLAPCPPCYLRRFCLLVGSTSCWSGVEPLGASFSLLEYRLNIVARPLGERCRSSGANTFMCCKAA